MKARGKREAQRNASPLVTKKYLNRALKVRNTTSIIPLFQSFTAIARVYQGRRASRCSALAPGFYIPRLRRIALPHIRRRSRSIGPLETLSKAGRDEPICAGALHATAESVVSSPRSLSAAP